MCYCNVEQPRAFRNQNRVARKPHTCYECGGTIEPKSQYEYASGVWDKPHSYKTCSKCLEIRCWLEKVGKQLRLI